MKKLIKIIIAFIVGIFIGYYLCNINLLTNPFKDTFKAFQIGVYTNYETANTYASKYKDSIVIKDDELFRVYAAILKDEKNIEKMSKYLYRNDIDYYLKDIYISDIELLSEIKEYENLMNNNQTVFLEINKIIMEKYKESL